MKSTLPALFRIQSRQKPTKITLSPEKQVPFYSLNLTITHGYRTKIINPMHKNSMAQDRLPNKSKLSFKQRYSEYPSRSLSVQQDYSSIEHSTLEPLPLTSSYSHNSSHSNSTTHRPGKPFTLQEIDNIRINIKKVTTELHLLSTAMQQVPSLHEHYRQQFAQMSHKLNKQVEEVETEIRQKVRKLGELLSTLRRETNVQIKAMKRDMGILRDEVEEEISLVKDIQEQRTTIKQINF